MVGAMSAKPPDDEVPDADELSSTLHHVRRVQGEDGELSWSNLQQKIAVWVSEAAYGQNLPSDKSREDLEQEVMLQVFRDIDEFEVAPGASFSGWVRTIADRKLKDAWRRARAQSAAAAVTATWETWTTAAAKSGSRTSACRDRACS